MLKKGLLVASLALVTFGSVTSSGADSCSEAFSTASELTQEGHFVGARASLLRCSAEACPPAMRPLCVDDLAKLESRVPGVVVAVTLAGREVFDVRVWIDGKLVADHLDGKSIELDPGLHSFRLERGSELVEQSLVIREGEKSRMLTFALAPSGVPVPAVERRPIPWSVFVSGGATLAAAGVWIGFGASGFIQKSELDRCKGSCDPRSISSATTAFRVADVAGLTTLLGAAVATVLLVTRSTVSVRPMALDHGALVMGRGTF
jgi:hypothetical protein